ncbi:unnamed protein product [Prorocentrum cordatum]|uniref:Uncharacterized protein n=1 Tax=Prorocentrum cordatum TaxID=2364126 RepID=A0ABN9W215_9DINO|nr:unnamed protein product [Polarella glacialis]
MLPQHFELLKGLINPNYAAQAEQARNSRSKLVTSLLTRRPRREYDEGDEDGGKGAASEGV